MTQTSLSKIFVIIDEERGRVLKFRKGFVKGSMGYRILSSHLRSLNRFKKEFNDLLDTDEPALCL